MDYAFNSLLAPLSEPPRRTRQFTASLLSHTAVLMVVALIPITHPEIITARPSSTYLVMPLISEYQPPKHIATEPKIKMPAAPRVETLAKLEAPQPSRHLERDIAPPKITPAKFEPVVAAPTPAAPKLARQVKTGVLGEGSSATPTVKAPVQQVQTGGFGDANGVNGEGRGNARLLVAHLGSPDLPFGGGYGNGSGGSHGVRGTVASAGFGSGVATSIAGGQGQGNGRVQAGGFGDASVVASSPRPRMRTESDNSTPVEILSKPRPIYTAEARQLKIEGEVLLEVVFGADGSLRVQRITRGLGHGLDEAAVKAAQQIRFHPARRDGQSFDSTAVLHIVFQLAY